ncbi:MAG: hypothetical protein HN509_13055 [Halobacteriovoraceae bacterium]|jgi:hypothetical protein|nr:hypothetical protein [Halobacteriovoraceae bacterium]MBT5095418.1 hypothetical protein [Halobacteriovoraceae bacterium]
MIGMLLKFVFFYFVFTFIRGLWRSYITVQQLKKGMHQNPGATFRSRPEPRASAGKTYDNGQTVEAECRTINETD